MDLASMLLTPGCPIHWLPYEVLVHAVFPLLPPTDMLACQRVSRAWHGMASDTQLWRLFCRRLWEDKVYIPAKIRDMLLSAPQRAYFESIRDSKRTWITTEELCDFKWSFRFKKAAGEMWRQVDPWWHDMPPIRMGFLPDGRTLIPIGFPSPLADGSQRFWKFVSSAAGRSGPPGSIVQVNNYPPYIVSRFHNWGFMMQSCWVLYASFPLPPRGAEPLLEDAALGLTTFQMRREIVLFNSGWFANQENPVDVDALLAQLDDAQEEEEEADSDDDNPPGDPALFQQMLQQAQTVPAAQQPQGDEEQPQPPPAPVLAGSDTSGNVLPSFDLATTSSSECPLFHISDGQQARVSDGSLQARGGGGEGEEAEGEEGIAAAAAAGLVPRSLLRAFHRRQ
jgi:hypothetical protein